MTPAPDLPLSFRQELAPHVFKAVQGGNRCAVVGPPGFGQSNLLRFVVEPRVAEHYLGAEAGQSLMMHVEADRLLDLAELFTGLARQWWQRRMANIGRVPSRPRYAGWPTWLPATPWPSLRLHWLD